MSEAAIKKTPVKRLRSEDWLGKASAGLILGLTLSFGLSGLVGAFVLSDVSLFSIAHQFTMWITGPILVLILSTCFLFQSGTRAWGWLGLANVLVWGLLWVTS